MIITYTDPKSPTAEAYRVLRTNIQFVNIDKNIRSIVITSSEAEEGKSTVIVNYAITLAQSNKKILLIDGDLRKPSLHKFFDTSNNKGLTNIIFEDTHYQDVTHTTIVENLDLLTSGPIPPNPSEVLGSVKMKGALDYLKEVYDIILIDSPPVGLVTDSAILSTIVDGTIFVCEAGKTKIDTAKYAKSCLDKVNANILGVVLNKIPIENKGYYKYPSYQYYNSNNSNEVKKKVCQKDNRFNKGSHKD